MTKKKIPSAREVLAEQTQPLDIGIIVIEGNQNFVDFCVNNVQIRRLEIPLLEALLKAMTSDYKFQAGLYIEGVVAVHNAVEQIKDVYREQHKNDDFTVKD